MTKKDDGLVVTLDENELMTMDVRLDPEGEVRAGADAKKDEPKPVEKKVAEAKDRADDDGVEREDGNADAMESLRRQLAQLQAERDAERVAREEAQRTAYAAVDVADSAKLNSFRSRYDMITGHIASAESREASIKSEIKAALESGDAGRAADLQMEAAKVAARKLQYEDAKADVEAAYQRYKSQRETELARKEAAPSHAPAPVQHADPFEAQIASLSEPSKQWLRQHRECVTDRATNAKVLWAHEEALKRGISPDTPAYFDHLERKMGYRQDGDDGDDGDRRTETRSSRAPAAPVSRHNSSPDPRTGYMGNNRYQLSPEEARMAETLGMTPTEYATHKIKAIKAGRYDNN